jgi:propionyl-CoA synthetase
MLRGIWGDDNRYEEVYWSKVPGKYLAGDNARCDDDGYYWIMGRIDDVLNVAGHRLSTGSMEAALAGHEAVAECAVIGVHDDFKGQLPRALVVLKAGVDGDGDGERIRAELVQRVRDEVGAVAALHQVDIVPALPKTRSGKILRKTMREIADGKPATVPGTIEDASVLDTLRPVLRPQP